MTARIFLIALIFFLAVSILIGAPLAIFVCRGYGIELLPLGICVVSLAAAVTCLGVWLFLRARRPRNTI